MARVQRVDNRYPLGGSKDTDLEELEPKYEVFTDTDKLKAAETDFPDYTWFASYTIQEDGKDVDELPHDYVITFDKLENPNSKLYYYLQGQGDSKGTVHEVRFEATANKGDRQRVKAYLRIGDPPMGSYP